MPTLKQKRLLKAVGKGRSFQQAAIEAGYAPTTARQQQNITDTKGWQELLHAYLPDDKLLQAHDEALQAVKIVTSPTEPDSTLPDHAVRLTAVKLGYQVKGYLTQNVVQNNIGEMTLEFISNPKDASSTS